MMAKDEARRPRKVHALRVALWVTVGLVAALLVLVWFLASADRTLSSDAPYGSPFQLVDQNGAAITESALRGRPSAVFFGFTHCPEVCPTTLYELAGHQKALAAEGEALNVVFVSVDPERDTPAVLKDYVAAVSDGITAVTGEPEKIAAMLDAWGIQRQKVGDGDDYMMDHTASVILLDDAGRFFGTISYGENPDAAREKLERLVRL